MSQFRFIRRGLIIGLLALPFLSGLLAVANAAQAGEVNAGTFSGVAIEGYDPVAYFTESRPVEGSSSFAADYKGATWHFASAANRDRFLAEPGAFAPQYGGYCAWAVSLGYTASIDPDAWRIVDRKLYLNYSLSVQRRWEADIPGHIAAGDRNWPQIKETL